MLPRRSTRHTIKDDGTPSAENRNGTPRTRRQSVINTPTTITLNPSVTQYKYNKKMNEDQILNDLENSEDEFENHGKEKHGQYKMKLEKDSLKVKIIKLPEQTTKPDIEFVLGGKMIRQTNSSNSKCIQENLATPKKQNITTLNNEVSPRKRPNDENQPENNQASSDSEIYTPLKEKKCKHLKFDKTILETPSKSKKNLTNPLQRNQNDQTPSKQLAKLKLSDTPNKNLDTPTRGIKNLSIKDTPTRGTEKFNINENDTPSSKQKRKLKENSNKKSTEPSRKYNTRGRQANYREYNSDDEAGTSDDQYLPKESSEDDSESEVDEKIDEDFSPKRQKAVKKILDTPKKTPKKLVEVRTPLVHRRSTFIPKPSTPLQEARQKLHVSVVPKSLPCREEQFNDIYSFLHARLSDGSGGCIYISGVPGTGKTATVNEVIRCLKKAMDSNKLTKFDYIDINGMKLSEPRQAYVQIWKQFTNVTTTWEEAQKLLHERFTKSNAKRNMTLLLVDELDLLCTKRQDVVYNLLDWPSKTNAKLVVVTIANTMDLPERILMGKVTSRLGLTRLTFPPYNHKQLEEIVVSRLRSFNETFKNETIQLVARKVAAVSGDARRALDICRRATEIAEMNDRETVTMIDVKKALDEMIASPKIQAIKHCSDMEKIFLQAVCAEVTRTGVEEVVFKNVYYQMETLCTLNGMKASNITETLFLCARLGSWRLLLCDHSRMDIHQRLILNVSTDDVHFATQNIET